MAPRAPTPAVVVTSLFPGCRTNCERSGHLHDDVYCVNWYTVSKQGAGRKNGGQDSDYQRLDGPGIESRWEARFSIHVQTCPVTHPAPYKMGTGSLSRGVKRPDRGINHPQQSSAEDKARVELCLYYPSGHSWPVLGRTLPFTFCS
jgi:hypothetical protein